MKTSHYDLNKLGYTRVTMKKTMRNEKAIWSKSLKFFDLYGSQSETRMCEAGIISNRES